MMENPNPGAAFHSTFTPSLCAAIVDGLRRAYDTACEHHVPEQGSNETTFGFNLYHHAVHELCGQADDVGAMEVNSRHPLFRLGVGEYELACHRVGNSERENVWASFPNNEGAACLMVEEQLWLPGMVQHLGAEKARKLILAHFGNPEDGLRAVYLCIPGKSEKQKITAWAFAQQLWQAEDSSMPASFPALPPEEVVDAPVVRRKLPWSTDLPMSAEAKPAVPEAAMKETPAEDKPAQPEQTPEEKVEQAKVHRKDQTADGKTKVGDDEIG